MSAVRFTFFGLWLAVACAGCSNAAPLSVDLRTDFVSGREFVRVETTLTDAQPDASTGTATVRRAAHSIVAGGDYLAGVRVAEIGGVPPGAYTLRVNLLDAHAAMVATRRVDVTVTGHTSVTVVMTRNCQGIVCPLGGDPNLTECVDDRCVDPRCSATTPQFCPSPTCTRDDECSTTGCGRASCAGGICLTGPSDVRCGAGMICASDLHCVPAPDAGEVDPFDAGQGHDAYVSTGTETSCTNGIDDDANGATDCDDAQCNGAGCDDGVPCTSGDSCRGGHCVGDLVVCTSDVCVARSCNGTAACALANAGFGSPCPDDGNPCTLDLCDGHGSCAHPAATDGQACGTGELHCCGGTCVNVTTDATNCGACGVHCVAGHPCMRIPTTNFGTCGCTAPYDSACAGYGPGAWCSPAGRCQCTCGCPTTGPCDQTCRACGSGTATCRDINGMDNWCYY